MTNQTYMTSFLEQQKIRLDKKKLGKPKCKKGKPCGDRCIPRNQKCKSESQKITWRDINRGLEMIGTGASVAILGASLGADIYNAYQVNEHNKKVRKFNDWLNEYEKKQKKGEAYDPPEEFFGKEFNDFYKQNTGHDFKDHWEQTKKQNSAYEGSSSKTSSGKEYWEVLGVDKDATPDQIKKAYKQKMRENHPDLGGDEEVSKKINEAYDVYEKNQEFKNKNRKDSYSYLDEIHQAYKIASERFTHLDSSFWSDFSIDSYQSYQLQVSSNYTKPLAYSTCG